MNNSKHNYRLYSFAHNWLSSIQKGIQTAHVVAEMMDNKGHKNIIQNWAEADKTIILLNGGNSDNLYEIKRLLADNTLFPQVCFKEDRESLEGAMTAVGTILPEWFYSNFKSLKLIAKEFKEEDFSDYNSEAFQKSKDMWREVSQLSASILDKEEIVSMNKLALKISSLKLAS